MSSTTNSIKTPNHEAIASEGCDWIVGPAETVTLNGPISGWGVMVEQDAVHPFLLEMEIDTGIWDRETGEIKTVTWVFEADEALGALVMLVEMAERIHAAQVEAEKEMMLW